MAVIDQSFATKAECSNKESDREDKIIESYAEIQFSAQ